MGIRGSILLESGDGKGAERDFREVLRLLTSNNAPSNATALINRAQLGDALVLQGRFVEAHQLQAEAAEQLRLLMGADSYQNTLIATRRAGAYFAQGDWRNAAIHTREAIRIVEKVHGREHYNFFLWNLNLAGALLQLPDGRDEATQIADLLIESWQDNPQIAREVARLMLIRCELYSAAGNVAAARSLAAATLARPELVASVEQRATLARFAADR